MRARFASLNCTGPVRVRRHFEELTSRFWLGEESEEESLILSRRMSYLRSAGRPVGNFVDRNNLFSVMPQANLIGPILRIRMRIFLF